MTTTEKTYTMGAIKEKFYNNSEDRSKLIGEITESLDDEIDYDKSIDILEKVMETDKRRTEKTGAAIDYGKMDAMDKLLWIAREAYRLGASYGVGLVLTVVNDIVEDMERGKDEDAQTVPLTAEG